MWPPNRNKNKTHKAQQQVPKTKTKTKLQCSILKPESISMWKFVKQLCKLLQHFLLFKCSRSWNPRDGTHSLLLLKKELFTSSSTNGPTLLSQAGLSVLNFSTFCLFSDPPHAQTRVHRHITRLHQPQSL